MFIIGLSFVAPAALAGKQSHFSITDTHLSDADGVYYLDVSMNLELGNELLNALQSGVPLVFLVEVELYRPRTWLPDEVVGSLQQSFELSLHFLTQRYVVRNINTDLQRTFASLASALDALSHISQLPLIDTDLVKPEDTSGRVRVAIDSSSLPMPLRLNAYTDKVWRASSDWVKWSLN